MNILCYGDSNTYGLTQDWKDRLPRDVRWTGVLRALLGEAHDVVEDGLVGRSCAVPDRHRYGRAAVDFLPVAIECHSPLDYLVLALGTNDCKTEKARSVAEAAAGMERLIRLAKELLPETTRIVILTPAPLTDRVLETDPDFDALAITISRQLAPAHAEIAARYGCLHLDLGAVAQPGDGDGEHLDAAGHRAVGEAVAALLRADMTRTISRV